MSELATVEPWAKRPRTGPSSSTELAFSTVGTGLSPHVAQEEEEEEEEVRTSNLSAPIMLLSGHEGAVYSFGFCPDGEHAASAGAERSVFLWDVFGDCANYNVLAGHKNAITQLRWFEDARTLATASADKTVLVWDAHVGRRKKKCAGHTAVVNALAARGDENLLASCGDDSFVLLWDPRLRGAVGAAKAAFPLTSVDLSLDAATVFAAGIEEKVFAWDIRKVDKGQTISEPIYELAGHNNTITGLALSPDGTHLLSNGMDGKLMQWDVRPLSVSGDRHVATFEGLKHDFHKNLLRCAWSPDGEKVSAGSSDQIVHIWDVATTEELYYLPGHSGCVNDVDFHPKEPIIASASSDRTIFLGEIS